MALGLLALATSAVLEIPPFLPSVAAGVILIGLGFPWLVVSEVTLTQRLTPAELQGRVYSAANVLIVMPQTVSIAAGAALIGFTGYQPLLASITIVTALAGGYLLSRPEQRRTHRSRSPEPQHPDHAAPTPSCETNADSPDTNKKP